jgi:site-specific DNA-methyltransferase (adenine-specific)
MNLFNDDNLKILKTLPDNSIDSCVTDPPYGLSFLGKTWDVSVPSKETWEEVYRVLKPGAHLVAFFGTRTYHRGVCAIEDAGFEIRDMVAWLYGTGFPKSHNISKDMDRIQGVERNIIGKTETKVGVFAHSGGGTPQNINDYENVITEATSDLAKQWDGWGTALKPAIEPIVLARKPLEESTVARNVLKHGTGAINIDDCKIESGGEHLVRSIKTRNAGGSWRESKGMFTTGRSFIPTNDPTGRWPANVVHDGSDEVVNSFPNNTSRFFYSAKTSVSEKEEGLENFIPKHTSASEFRPNHMEKAEEGETGSAYGRFTKRKNIHPTVKPTSLMEYLITLVTPPNGTVIDPYMGSGSTGKAAIKLGFDFIGMELDPEYYEIAKARIEHEKKSIPSLKKFLT